MRLKSIFVSLLIIIAVVLWMAGGDIGNEAVRSAALEKEAEKSQSTEKTEQAFLVTIDESRSESFSRQIQVNGRTKAQRRSVIRSEINATVTEILVKEGQNVSKGDLLIKLSEDTRPAAYSSALAGLKSAAKNYSAIKNLSNDGYQSELQVLQGKEALTRAEQAVIQSKKALDDTKVTAPYDGIVDDITVELGDSLSVGSAIVSLIDLDPIDAVAFVSERELDNISIGDNANIELLNGETYQGNVHYIAASSDISTGTFEIRISIDNQNLRLREGITSYVTVFSKDIQVHFQPKSLLTLNNKGIIGIKGVDEENRVVFYPVEIIEDTQNGFYLAGLPSKASLIISGQDFVKSGNIVRTENKN